MVQKVKKTLLNKHFLLRNIFSCTLKQINTLSGTVHLKKIDKINAIPRISHFMNINET